MTFLCTICETKYKTYQSLWNHNHRYHADANIKVTNKMKIGDFKCVKCDSTFTRKNNMVNHMKKFCKNKDVIDKTAVLEQQILELKKKVDILENNKTTINGNVNNGTVNNTINNTIYLNKIGTENILELNKKEINDIFNKRIESVITFVEKINFNERLLSNHTFCTTDHHSPYLSVYNTDDLTIDKDRKKYFFEQLFSKAVTKMEELYKLNKKKFNETKQKEVEETLTSLKEIKNMDMNERLFREILRKLDLLSYNKRKLVKNTWNNFNIKNNVPKTFEEDLELGFDNDPSYNILDTFIPQNNHDSEAESETDSDDSDSYVLPKLVPTKRIIKKEITV